MKQPHKRSIFAWTTAGWLCLLVASCTTATMDESTGNTEPADAATTGPASGEEQADAKPTDIIDRMFSPLDNAVSDINRDLNKGDPDASTKPNE